MRYVACITLFILWLCRESHNIVQLHIYARCNKRLGKMCSSKYCSQKYKQKLLCNYLAWTLL